MNVAQNIFSSLAVGLVLAGSVEAQTSSMGAQKRRQDSQRTPAEIAEEAATQSAGSKETKTHPAYDKFSWITARPVPPPTFKVNDLVTVIIRETSKYEADADLKSDSKYDVKSELEAFVKPFDGGLGAAVFRRGKPNIEYKYQTKSDNKADTSREDKFTTRITGKIIDVKPNGLLVLEARGKFRHDEEIVRVTLTGTCRRQDVSANNSVLSTQLADKQIEVRTEGAVRDGARRGWIRRLVDALKPV